MALKSKQIDLSPITRLQGQFQREDYLGKAIKGAVGGIGEGIQEAKKQRMFNQARFLEEMKLKISDAHKQFLGDDVDKFIDEYSKKFQEKRGKFKTQDWIELSKAKEAINNKEARMKGVTDIFNEEAPIALKSPETYELNSALLESTLKDIGEGNAINPIRNPFTNMMFVEFRDIDLDSVNEQIKRDYRKAYKEPGGETSTATRQGQWTYTRSNYGDEEKAKNYATSQLASNQRALAKATTIYAGLPEEVQAKYQDSATPITDWFMDQYNVGAKYVEPTVKKDYKAYKPDKPGEGKVAAKFSAGEGKPTTIDKTRFNDYFSFVNLPSSKRFLKAVTLKGAVETTGGKPKDITAAANYEIMGYDGDRDVIVLRMVKDPGGDKPIEYEYYYVPREGNEQLLEGRLAISSSRSKISGPAQTKKGISQEELRKKYNPRK